MPQWSPDGRRIAFTARPAGDKPGHWKLYSISADGGKPQEMIPGDSDQANPSWSPDGESLAFAGAPWMTGFAAASTSVSVFDLRTRQVSTIPGSEGLWSPRWSPDGRFIVAETVDSIELKVYDLLLKRWRSLTRTTHLIGYSAWSHDSKYVYFNTLAAGSAGPAISRVSVTGRGMEPVLSLNALPWGTLGQWFGLTADDSLLGGPAGMPALRNSMRWMSTFLSQGAIEKPRDLSLQNPTIASPSSCRPYR